MALAALVSWADYIVHIPDNFHGSQGRAFLDAAPDYPVYATVLYLLAVFYLPQYLAKRKLVYELKWVVAGWNLFLSVVSTIGAYYTLRLVYLFLVEMKSFHCIVCEMPDMGDDELLSFSNRLHRSSTTTKYARQDYHDVYKSLFHDMADRYYNGKYAYWVALFLYLKTPELLDTVFLILQGKPVSFLHWYHHIVTAVFCWHAAYVLIPSGLFFATMNYCVHSIMYFYYFLVMLGLRKRIRPFAPCITVLQCLQMFVGMGITAYTYLQHWLGPNKQTTYFYLFFEALFAALHHAAHQARSLYYTHALLPRERVPEFSMGDYFYGCGTDTTNMRMGIMMYGSYCVLFVVLFKELYLDKRASKHSLVLARKAKAARRELERSRKLDGKLTAIHSERVNERGPAV